MFKSRQTYKLLLETIDYLRAENRDIKAENALLRARIEELEHTKNSHNSSIAPSKDENRAKKNQSLRVKSGRKPGGQKGHKGSVLEMTEIPDEIIKHIPQYCNNCGEELAGVMEELIEKRQEVVLPRIIVKYIEHQIYSKKCSCGHTTQSEFPLGINAKVQYGSRIA